jgi:hypothetical protein
MDQLHINEGQYHEVNEKGELVDMATIFSSLNVNRCPPSGWADSW